MYYFAYGSCMDAESFSNTVGKENYEVLGAAVLPDYRLAFNLYSETRKGGVADVVMSPGDQVEGVLYRLSPEALPPLDQREGVELGRYRRVYVNVHWQGRVLSAMTYTVVEKLPDEIPPSMEYARLVYNGARQQLSDAYRKKLVREWSEKFGLDDFLKKEDA
ncbi:gamma-glutamylcyclotransferase family protein [Lihuaxuella thermophila]|uniref:Gamma-glutamylcyclotransferase n=1 Tax=Lihuaxuella thermophila TaxID=1173111 RepID=A0A1H8ARH0_9BACL|nr:gamma-glutamylcyclotransferase family protein [Lihuaxuella thermophila]SEM72409.1 gamma-glutamylcyclotransferase [Lihuaxuella thermophila]